MACVPSSLANLDYRRTVAQVHARYRAHRSYLGRNAGRGRPAKTTSLTMPNLSQGRAPQTAVMLEPKNLEPGSASEKGESYGHVPRGRQKQKYNDRRSSGGGNPRDHLPLHSGPFVRNSLRRRIHPSFHTRPKPRPISYPRRPVSLSPPNRSQKATACDGSAKQDPT